jgi:[CysO sulfur-carrier protein]-S-L-cysteine hydrolase
MLRLNSQQLNQIVAHARATHPHECCGLIGGVSEATARSVYQLDNAAADPLVTYEAASEELFNAQRLMRERGEQLLAIYHSHPRAAEPAPSVTDVRLAFYPAAIYLIIGLGGAEPVTRAFRISEKEQLWEAVEYEIVDE